jgi:hypothetical protein
MKRNRKVAIIIILVLAAGGVALAAAESGYFAAPIEVMDQGGNPAQSALYGQHASVGGAVVGKTDSASYKLSTNFFGRGTLPTDWLRITQTPQPMTIGAGNESVFKWISTHDGDFWIELDGNGTPGCGTMISTGSVAADDERTETIYDTDLNENEANDVYVIVVDDSAETKFRVVTIIVDTEKPFLEITCIAVSGTVNDEEAVVKINDVAVPLTGGAFDAEVVTNLDSIVVEITNDRETVYKYITVEYE